MSVRDVISIFYSDSKARLGELVVDGFLSETHTMTSKVTEHPVESGTSIVDHVYQEPFTLAIEGIISNTPMSLVGFTTFDSAKRYIEGENNNFVLVAFENIEELFEKRKPISIVTSLKTYHKMVLESLSIERGGGAQDALRFSCIAKQIKFVKQESIKIPEPKVSRAEPKQKQGLQETKPVSPERAESLKKDHSLLFSVGKWLMGN